ncbi:MAG: glycosyl hydrolase-related protein [Thermoguttaceae bacterium]
MKCLAVAIRWLVAFGVLFGGPFCKFCFAAEPAANKAEPAAKPGRPWVIYILPHSHVDIGYTHIQTEVEKLQWKYLDQVLELARKTADYPPEARFKWNTEVLWAVESYLKQAAPEKRKAFIEAVKAGQIHLDALYGNELTGLCRPEELYRLLGCARRLSQQYDLRIDAAMISDVPGWTWGIVPALAHHGVKYLSMGPNHMHRIGYTLEQWADRPFYWVSPSGQEKVLCWVAGKGYAWFHPGLQDRIGKMKPEAIFQYLAQLEAAGFPYDMVQLRYSIGGDNGPPDPELPEAVKKWNIQHPWPKLRIATTRELMEEFERRYGEKIPEVRGDFTPYWEDGAASSALETGLARTASERLVQAETLFAMLNVRGYPSESFYQAWRSVLLYNEHTWGAHCSITQPDSELTKAQWKIKRAFAADADSQSGKLVASVLVTRLSQKSPAAAVDVFNTASWARTDLVVLPASIKVAGTRVTDAQRRVVPSQRLSSGGLAFLAADVPPLGAKRFLFQTGDANALGKAAAEGLTIGNQRLRATVDPETGGIASLTAEGIPGDLARTKDGFGLNEYFYVAGRDPKSPQRSGKPTVTVRERGPLVAILVVASDAPGCRKLVRELRVVDGLDRLDITDVLDRPQVRTPEGIHLGFALNVPDGVMRLDIPWGVLRPEVDQLPGACKNYLSVGRWLDVSNAQFGLTVATVDAPLVEIGRIRMDVVPSPFEPKNWVKKIEPSQTFFSYVMNNYWETNYKADQEGLTGFRYSLWPHGRFDPAAASRFGIERSQPLVVVPVSPKTPVATSMLAIDPPEVLLSSLKPSEDKKGVMVRLLNASQRPAQARVQWQTFRPKRISLSSPREEEGEEVSGPIPIAPWGIVTLRAALPQ